MIQAEYMSNPEVTYVPRIMSIVFVIGHFTVVCVEPWPLIEARLVVTLFFYRPLVFFICK